MGVLDCAVLVVSGRDGVQAHTETLWRLLRRYDVPIFLFVTKMDLPDTDRARLLQDLTAHLDERILDFTARPADEELAMCSEAALERYMAEGTLSDGDVTELISKRALFPCFFGAALRNEGIEPLLDFLSGFADTVERPKEFGAKVYKIVRDPQGARLTFLKVTGGCLKARDPLSCEDCEFPWTEKIAEIR